MSSPLVSRSEAMKNPTHHQHIPGVGYLAHSGPPELPEGSSGSANCSPPKGAAEGSIHVLEPPNGHPPLRMKWSAKHEAWMAMSADKGNRLAWTPAHLSAAGWRYHGQ